MSSARTLLSPRGFRGARPWLVSALVVFVLGSSLASLSCSKGKAPVPTETAALGGNVAARVGDEVIGVPLVASVASAEHVSPDEARARLVDDAIAATGARARGLDRGATAFRLVAARARFTADRLLEDAKAKGPPTDEEVRTLSQEHWREVDRPVAVRVVHALVKRPEHTDPATMARARELAEALLRDVKGARDAEDFKAKAKAAAHPPALSVVVEDLPPFIDTGELIEGPGGMVTPFAKAAHAIAHPGETSGLVETPFGWHVIRLVERLPEQRMPFESRRIAFAEAIYARRAREELDGRLRVLSARFPHTILPSAEELMLTLQRDSRPKAE